MPINSLINPPKKPKVDLKPLRAKVKEMNEKYGIEKQFPWTLKVTSKNYISWHPEHTDEKNRIKIRDAKGEILDDCIEEAARRSAIGLGRTKELIRFGYSLDSPLPRWTYASTPILTNCIQTQIKNGSELAKQRLYENCGVVSSDMFHNLRESDKRERYHYNIYEEILDGFITEIPETVLQECIGQSLGKIMKIGEIDLSQVKILSIENSSVFEGKKKIKLKSQLIRFETPPPNVILEPEEAWLQETKRRAV